ncbi:MAG: bifunctional demethylmenaquinone methyltransferase/2-methoxy-6-polyprenyl-1,4-benzoquinol methylase UbiE [Terriglobia bacterium]
MPNAPPPGQGSPLGNPGDPASTARAVRSMFASVAPRYDFLNHFLSCGTDIAWRHAAARALRAKLEAPDSIAVDVCCGTGDLALALARYSGGRVLGTDFCHPMLVRGVAKARGGAKAVSFFEADTLALPFRDGSLDVVSVAFGFRNLASYRAGLAEFLRVLKPGGVAAILEFSRVRWPLFGSLFRLYFHHVLPRLGTWISGVKGAYQYLPESVSLFPDQESLARGLVEAGFSKVSYRDFLGGVAALHLGEK